MLRKAGITTKVVHPRSIVRGTLYLLRGAPMNASPNRLRGIAAFTILAFAFSIVLGGCSNKTNTVPVVTNTVPVVQAPPGAPTTNVPPQAAEQAPVPAPGLTLPRGTRLQVRLDQTIDVKHVTSGERFTGTLAEPVVVANTVAVPSGSTATGEVLVAHRRGRFKGKSMMALTLTQLDVNGTQYRIDTSNLSRTKSGKGRRSAAFIGGGAGMGMLIGGVATGGVGLLVGGLAGGGAGALGAAFTGNRDLAIPAESVVSFRLQDGLTLAPESQANSGH
jgi:hypothetical protein